MNLKEHVTFESVKEMNDAVNNHIYYNADQLPKSNRTILRKISEHCLGNIGACRVKISTIATETALSEATVNRAIKRLKDLHVIEVVKGTKMNGIQGANIYRILNFTHEVIVRERERETTERATHAKPTESRVEDTKKESESFNSFKTSLNLSVVKNVVNNVAAPSDSEDLKQLLRDAYKPKTQEQERDFSEMCKIAFGRLKQFMKLYNLPYLQIKDIVVRCMHQLMNKTGVNNPFAMYSKMIKRQVEQLFEEWVKPVKTNVESLESKSKEYIPEWFGNRNDERNKVCTPSTVNAANIDFGIERQKVLAKLGVE